MPNSMGAMTSRTLMHPASTRTTHNLIKRMTRAAMTPMGQEGIGKMLTMANRRILEQPRSPLATTNQGAPMTKGPLHEPLLGSAYFDRDTRIEPLPEQGAEILLLYSRPRDLRHWRYEHHGALWTKVGLIVLSS